MTDTEITAATLTLGLLSAFLLGVVVMNLIAGWCLRRVLQDVTDAYREDIEQTDRVLEFARSISPTNTDSRGE